VILTNAFKAMDSDGDKVVSHVEMVVFLNRKADEVTKKKGRNDAAGELKELPETFKKADANDDTFLSKEELDKNYHEGAEGNARWVFADENKDNKLSEHEFFRFLYPGLTRMSDPRFHRLMARGFMWSCSVEVAHSAKRLTIKECHACDSDEEAVHVQGYQGQCAHADSNGDGYLDVDELTRMSGALHLLHLENHSYRMLQIADRDMNKVFTLEEFLTFGA